MMRITTSACANTTTHANVAMAMNANVAGVIRAIVAMETLATVAAAMDATVAGPIPVTALGRSVIPPVVQTPVVGNATAIRAMTPTVLAMTPASAHGVNTQSAQTMTSAIALVVP